MSEEPTEVDPRVLAEAEAPPVERSLPPIPAAAPKPADEEEDEEELDVDELVELDGEELEILEDDEDEPDEDTAPRRVPPG